MATTIRDLTYGYDDLGRLIQEVSQTDHAGSGPDLPTIPNYKVAYAFDLCGNRTEKTVTNPVNGSAIAYIKSLYNGLDQLTSQAQSLSPTVSTGVIDPTAPTNAAGTTNYTYTPAGFLQSTTTSGGTVRSDYDPEGRLWRVFNTPSSAVADPPATSNPAAFYTYDADGSLVGVRTGAYAGSSGDPLALTSVGRDEQYLVDALNPTGYSQVLQEKRAFCNNQYAGMNYVLGHTVLAQAGWTTSNGATANATPQLLLRDPHGSVRSQVKSAFAGAGDAISHRYDYDAYGNAIDFNPDRLRCTPGTANAADPLLDKPIAETAHLYCGERFEPSAAGVAAGSSLLAGTGQYYLRARYYSASVGRFAAPDEYEGDRASPYSFHKYLYASPNPVGCIDPSGNSPIAEQLVITGIRVGLFALNVHGVVSSTRSAGQSYIKAYESFQRGEM